MGLDLPPRHQTPPEIREKGGEEDQVGLSKTLNFKPNTFLNDLFEEDNIPNSEKNKNPEGQGTNYEPFENFEDYYFSNQHHPENLPTTFLLDDVILSSCRFYLFID